VIGLVNPKLELSDDSGFPFVAYSDRSTPYPRILLPGHPKMIAQVIIFAPTVPMKMQFISLSPISLAIEDKFESLNDQGGPPVDDVDIAERAEKQRLAALIEKMRLHTVIRFPLTSKELLLPAIINQVNCASEIDALLQKNIALVRSRSRRTLSVSERVVESATNLWDFAQLGLEFAFQKFIYPVIIELFIYALMVNRVAGEAVILMADWRFRPQGAALKDISATAQQVDLRLQQFCYWPIQYLTLQKGKDDWESITNNHSEYIRFYNSLWLVANDVIMGMAVGSFIIENADSVAQQVDTFLITWTIEGLRSLISWLMVYPAGLKLNTELAVFLGDLFLWVIEYWAGKFEAAGVYYTD